MTTAKAETPERKRRVRKPDATRKITKSAAKESKEKRLAELIIRLDSTRAKANELSAEAGLVQTEAVTLMQSMKLTETEVPSGTTTVHGTLVAPERVVVDWEKVKARVGSAVWNKITVRTPDSGLVDQAVKDGIIDPAVLAECATMKATNPYIKTTVKRVKK